MVVSVHVVQSCLFILANILGTLTLWLCEGVLGSVWFLSGRLFVAVVLASLDLVLAFPTLLASDKVIFFTARKEALRQLNYRNA